MVLRSVTNETLVIGEGDIRGCCSVTLVVGDDFNSIILPHADAAIMTKVSDHYMHPGDEDTYEYVVPRSIPMAFDEDIIDWEMSISCC